MSDAADVPDLSVASVQLLLRTRELSRSVPVDGIWTERLDHAIARVVRKYDWTELPPADVLLEWIRALPPLPVGVPRIRTPCGGELLRGVLWMGHLRISGRPAGDDRLRLATLHLARVHGEDMADVWTWNLGDWGTRGDYDGAWCSAPGGERRAYAEPLEGAEGHWACLEEQRPDLLEAFDAGDERAIAR